MRFSYCVIPTMTAGELVAQARRSESEGVDLLWIPDEKFFRDPYVNLGAIAASTSRLDLGVGIANPYTRHPIQIARAVATVQDFRDRPVILGIGAGLKVTRTAMAAPTGKFVEVTRDAVRAIKDLFAGRSVTMANDVFRMENAQLGFVPAVTPKVYVASTHPDAFRMAGEIADGVIVGNVAEPEAMRAVVAFVREGAEKAGRDPAEVEIVAWNMAICGEDIDALADIIRDMVGRTITASHSRIRALLGVSGELEEKIVGAVKGDRFPLGRELISNDLVSRFAFLGSAETCARRILDLKAVGVDIVGVRPTLEISKALDYEANVLALQRAIRAAGG